MLAPTELHVLLWTVGLPFLHSHFIGALQICKDCRCNVMRAYKDLKPCGRDQKAGEQTLCLDICAGHKLTVNDGLVCVDGKATTEFFEQAEEVEDCNVSSRLCCDCQVPALHMWDASLKQAVPCKYALPSPVTLPVLCLATCHANSHLLQLHTTNQCYAWSLLFPSA